MHVLLSSKYNKRSLGLDRGISSMTVFGGIVILFKGQAPAYPSNVSADSVIPYSNSKVRHMLAREHRKNISL
jgi:hypothetical protein